MSALERLLVRILAAKPKRGWKLLRAEIKKDPHHGRKIALEIGSHEDLSPGTYGAISGSLHGVGRDYYHRGNDLYESGHYEEAHRAYSLSILLCPNFPEAYFNRALSSYNQREYEQALQDYNLSMLLDPFNPIIANNRGDCYYRMQRMADSVADYNEAIRLNPGYLKAHYNRGLAYACLQQYDLAINDFTRVIERSQFFPEAHHIRGLAYDYVGRHNEAIADYKRALELNPAFEEARSHLCVLEEKLRNGVISSDADSRAPAGASTAGQLEIPAIPPFQPPRRDGPAASVLIALKERVVPGGGEEWLSSRAELALMKGLGGQFFAEAGVHFEQREYPESLYDVGMAALFGHDMGPVLALRARIHLAQGDPAAAAADFRRALAHGVHDARIHLDLAEIHSARGDLDKAVSEYDRALQLGQGDPETHRRVASVYEQQQDYEKAIEHLERAIQVQPQNLDTFARMARCYELIGSTRLAVQTLLRGVRADPALTLAAGSDSDSLAAEVRAAATSQSDLLPDQQKLLARAHRLAGDWEAALALYRALLPASSGCELWLAAAECAEFLAVQSAELAALSTETGQRAEGSEYYAEAAQLRRRVRHDDPANLENLDTLSDDLWEWGIALILDGEETDLEREIWREVYALDTERLDRKQGDPWVRYSCGMGAFNLSISCPAEAPDLLRAARQHTEAIVPPDDDAELEIRKKSFLAAILLAEAEADGETAPQKIAEALRLSEECRGPLADDSTLEGLASCYQMSAFIGFDRMRPGSRREALDALKQAYRSAAQTQGRSVLVASRIMARRASILRTMAVWANQDPRLASYLLQEARALSAAVLPTDPSFCEVLLTCLQVEFLVAVEPHAPQDSGQQSSAPLPERLKTIPVPQQKPQLSGLWEYTAGVMADDPSAIEGSVPKLVAGRKDWLAAVAALRVVDASLSTPGRRRDCARHLAVARDTLVGIAVSTNSFLAYLLGRWCELELRRALRSGRRATRSGGLAFLERLVAECVDEATLRRLLLFDPDELSRSSNLLARLPAKYPRQHRRFQEIDRALVARILRDAHEGNKKASRTATILLDGFYSQRRGNLPQGTSSPQKRGGRGRSRRDTRSATGGSSTTAREQSPEEFRIPAPEQLPLDSAVRDFLLRHLIEKYARASAELLRASDPRTARRIDKIVDSVAPYVKLGTFGAPGGGTAVTIDLLEVVDEFASTGVLFGGSHVLNSLPPDQGLIHWQKLFSTKTPGTGPLLIQGSLPGMRLLLLILIHNVFKHHVHPRFETIAKELKAQCPAYNDGNLSMEAWNGRKKEIRDDARRVLLQEITSTQGLIHMALERDGRQIRLRFWDEGVGFDAEARQVFEKNLQGSPSAPGERLPSICLVPRLVEYMRGKLDVVWEAARSEGRYRPTFVFTFPEVRHGGEGRATHRRR